MVDQEQQQQQQYLDEYFKLILDAARENWETCKSCTGTSKSCSRSNGKNEKQQQEALYYNFDPRAYRASNEKEITIFSRDEETCKFWFKRLSEDLSDRAFYTRHQYHLTKEWVDFCQRTLSVATTTDDLLAFLRDHAHETKLRVRWTDYSLPAFSRSTTLDAKIILEKTCLVEDERKKMNVTAKVSFEFPSWHDESNCNAKVFFNLSEAATKSLKKRFTFHDSKSGGQQQQQQQRPTLIKYVWYYYSVMDSTSSGRELAFRVAHIKTEPDGGELVALECEEPNLTQAELDELIKLLLVDTTHQSR